MAYNIRKAFFINLYNKSINAMPCHEELVINVYNIVPLRMRAPHLTMKH